MTMGAGLRRGPTPPNGLEATGRLAVLICSIAFASAACTSTAEPNQVAGRQVVRGSPRAQGVDHAAEMEKCKAEILRLAPNATRFMWGRLNQNEGINRARSGQLMVLTQLGFRVKDFHCTFWEDPNLPSDFWID